jgi:asparagine synthase (glutamine-hydrolysing)
MRCGRDSRLIAHRDTPVTTQAARRGLERTLDLAVWLDLYAPEITIG